MILRKIKEIKEKNRLKRLQEIADRLKMIQDQREPVFVREILEKLKSKDAPMA